MKGNVIVNRIEVGDVHYEYGYAQRAEMVVIEAPVETKNDEGKRVWKWKSELENGEVINYMVTEGWEHYSSNLYDYEAYTHPDNKSDFWKEFNKNIEEREQKAKETLGDM